MVGICDILQMEMEAQRDSVISPRHARWVSCRAEPIICSVVISSVHTQRETSLSPQKVYKPPQNTTHACVETKAVEEQWEWMHSLKHSLPWHTGLFILAIQTQASRRVNMPERLSAFSTSVDLIKKIDSPHKSGLTLTNHLIWHKGLYSDSLNSTSLPETKVSNGLKPQKQPIAKARQRHPPWEGLEMPDCSQKHLQISLYCNA